MFAVDTVSYPPILTSGDSLCRFQDKKKKRSAYLELSVYSLFIE